MIKFTVLTKHTQNVEMRHTCQNKTMWCGTRMSNYILRQRSSDLSIRQCVPVVPVIGAPTLKS